ncbi:MAG TPA: F0F1 ATP synthase subunit A [Solirubrobacteraceae bacterium]|nr:F0F1 ATP synthase subunit A [Solirubrobacteraceae bacterium]
MSAVAAPNPGRPGMSKTRKILYGIALTYVLGIVVFVAAFGIKGHKNESFKVIDSFHLVPWVHLVGPLNIDKGVLYLLITAVITVGLTTWVAKRMEKRPGRVQVAIEWMYELMQRTTKDAMDEQMAQKWFPVIFTLFVFILVTNLIGYIPLPVDSTQKVSIFGAKIPAFQIYAADTNVALPLLLSLGVFVTFNTVGIKAQGFRGYVKSLVPAGVGKAMLILIYPLEVISTFLRLLSLTIRLWANLLAGHLLIDFMAGDLAVLLGLQLLGWITLPIGVVIFMFEAVLIAGLQAFIFAILTAIYIGGSVSHH